MGRYVLRRLIQAIPTILGITVLSFLIMSAAPGGPAAALTFDPKVPAKQREAMQEKLGFNDPLPVQYVRWLLGEKPIKVLGVTLWGGRDVPVFDRQGNEIGTKPGTSGGIIRLDFGRSLFYKRPVIDMLKQRAGATVQLGFTALVLGLSIGIPIGILSAVRRGSLFDNSSRVLAVLFNAVPVFWLGLMLILVFGKWLGALPMGNQCPLTIKGCVTLEDRVSHLVLPVFTLGTGWIAVLSRYMRTSTLDVLSQDYIRTAQAKGLPNSKVWFVHATRNALIPIATILGPAIPSLLSGAVITETIFSWPGLGRLSFEAVIQQDYPMVMAVVLLSGVITVLGYLLSDILYALIDPRIRLG
ncbi:MAG: ABC transporter permease [Chloroflexota bacterium]